MITTLIITMITTLITIMGTQDKFILLTMILITIRMIIQIIRPIINITMKKPHSSKVSEIISHSVQF